MNAQPLRTGFFCRAMAFFNVHGITRVIRSVTANGNNYRAKDFTRIVQDLASFISRGSNRCVAIPPAQLGERLDGLCAQGDFAVVRHDVLVSVHAPHGSR